MPITNFLGFNHFWRHFFLFKLHYYPFTNNRMEGWAC